MPVEPPAKHPITARPTPHLQQEAPGRLRALPKFDEHNHLRYDSDAGWSSLVARWAHNPKVGGSNPSPATNPPSFQFNLLEAFLTSRSGSPVAFKTPIVPEIVPK